MRRFTAFIALALAIVPILAVAEEEAAPKAKPKRTAVSYTLDPRGDAELTLCSQNLQNYGTYGQSKQRLYDITPEEFEKKKEALVARFKKAGCDVIAVQELLGKNTEQAEETLGKLAQALRTKTNRLYGVYAGESNDPLSRVGFIVAKDRVEVVNQLTYNKVELPKLAVKERPRFFIRSPMELQLVVKPRGESTAKTVTLVNFHFKSKAGKERDPTDLEWETYRMQMAEALRRVLEQRHAASFGSGETILAVVGDRNSNFDAASAALLEGALVLKQFQGTPLCRLSKRGVAICKEGSTLPARLLSVVSGDPTLQSSKGTYEYKGVYSFLDDILMPVESLRTAWKRFDKEGEYASGIIREPKVASDHALVYVKLNW